MELVRDALPPDVMVRDLGERRLKDLTRPEQIFQVAVPGLAADFPPLHTLDARPNNLPAQPNALIGREREASAVRVLLRRADVRLVTFTGPGGTGKTRLALQVASELLDEFAHGVWFVNLAPIGDPALVIPTIAQTLGVIETGDQPIQERLHHYLHEKRLLLLLDNFEQVVDAARLVAELLTGCPQLMILATSRAPLHLSGEREFAVPPLALPPQEPRTKNQELGIANQNTVHGSRFSVLSSVEEFTQYESVRLFIERAQAVKADFTVTNQSAPAVAEICHRLDGLPLAIVLAAARVKLFSPQALLARLEHRLQVLTGGARDLPARQQTLRNAIAWSYDLLDQSAQTLFARLAVFVGGCTPAAAVAVCNASGDLPLDMLDGLALLVDNSLLQREEGIDGEPRFVMLETIREYALERLEASGEAEAVLQQHANYYLAVAQAAELRLYGADQLTWLERLETEHDNLRAVLMWSQMAEERAEVGVRLTEALWWFWFVRGHLREGRAWLEQVLARSHISTAARATALLGAGWLAIEHHDSMRAVTLLEESLALHRELGDRRGVAWSLSFLGRATSGEQAITLHEESLALHRQLGDRRGLAWSLIGLGREAWLQHEPMRAAALFEEGLTLHRELGDMRNIAWSLWFLGVVTTEPERAVALLEESLVLHRKLGDQQGITSALNRLGWLAHNQRDDGRAGMLFTEVLALTREWGDKREIAWSLNAMGELARFRGDDAAARVYYDESLALRREFLDKEGIAMVLHNLGYVAQHQGDYGQATALFAESLIMCQEHEDLAGVGNCLDGLAGVAAVTGQPKRAARLVGAADALRNIRSARLEPVDRVEHERTVAVVRAQLDDSTFAAAWAAGQRMPLKQAIAEALGETPPEPAETSNHGV
jgi:predicted ATPase